MDLITAIITGLIYQYGRIAALYFVDFLVEVDKLLHLL
jgi:hypothetical protein